MSVSDDDHRWTVCPALCEQNVRAISVADVDISGVGAEEIDIVIDSGAYQLLWLGAVHH